MGSLATAPGVLGAAHTTYITAADVMTLLGCKVNTAYKRIREVNDIAEKKGYRRYTQGKASKYLFAECYGIPEDVIDEIIDLNQKQEV